MPPRTQRPFLSDSSEVDPALGQLGLDRDAGDRLAGLVRHLALDAPAALPVLWRGGGRGDRARAASAGSRRAGVSAWAASRSGEGSSTNTILTHALENRVGKRRNRKDDRRAASAAPAPAATGGAGARPTGTAGRGAAAGSCSSPGPPRSPGWRGWPGAGSAPGRCRARPGRRSPRVDRHPPCRRPRGLRQRARRDPLDRPPGPRRRALRGRPRHNVVTLPSHVNILSGRYPLAHGVRDNSGFRVPKDAPPWRRCSRRAATRREFRQRLRARLAVRPRPRLRHLRRPHRGRRVAAPLPDPGASGGGHRGRGPALEGQSRGSPFFSFVHLYEPHFPYEPPEPFASPSGAIPITARWPRQTRRSSPSCSRSSTGRGGAPLIVLTSDHGEGSATTASRPTGSSPTSRRCACRSWCGPRGSSAARGEGPVRHVDLLPTVLDVLGAPVPTASRPQPAAAAGAAGRGSGPAELLRGAVRLAQPPVGAPARPARGPAQVHRPAAARAVRPRGRPGGGRNLVASRPEDLERLRGRLAALRVEDRGIQHVAETREAVERLRALGYVSGSAEPKAEYTEDDDPKRLVDIDTRLSEMLDLYHGGRSTRRSASAATSCGAARHRPRAPAARLPRARPRKPRRRDRRGPRAVELRRTDTESIALLGVYLTEAGRAREAVALLEPLGEGPGRRPRRPDRPRDGARDHRAARGRARNARPRGWRNARNATVLVNIAHGAPAPERPRPRPSASEAARHRPERGSGAQRARCHRRPRAAPAEAMEPGGGRSPSTPGTTGPCSTSARCCGAPGVGRLRGRYLEAYLRAAPPALESRTSQGSGPSWGRRRRPRVETLRRHRRGENRIFLGVGIGLIGGGLPRPGHRAVPRGPRPHS